MVQTQLTPGAWIRQVTLYLRKLLIAGIIILADFVTYCVRQVLIFRSLLFRLT